jgi:hypothetical protein
MEVSYGLHKNIKKSLAHATKTSDPLGGRNIDNQCTMAANRFPGYFTLDRKGLVRSMEHFTKSLFRNRYWHIISFVVLLSSNSQNSTESTKILIN